MLLTENVRTTDHASGIHLQDCSKSANNWKKNGDVKICWDDVIITIFWHFHVSLVKFSYWSKFHVNIIMRSRVTTIFVYKRLIRNPKIGNTLVWVLSNTWVELEIPDLAEMSLMKNQLMLPNAKFTAFIVSELLRENQQGGCNPPQYMIYTDIFMLGLIYIRTILSIQEG